VQFGFASRKRCAVFLEYTFTCVEILPANKVQKQRGFFTVQMIECACPCEDTFPSGCISSSKVVESAIDDDSCRNKEKIYFLDFSLKSGHSGHANQQGCNANNFRLRSQRPLHLQVDAGRPG
jgi:hypothetical protein